MRNRGDPGTLEGGAIRSLRLVKGARKSNDDAASWRSDPDVRTMERLSAGDLDAFQSLYNKYSVAVTRFAYGYLHSAHRAEEVSQTVFLQIFRTRERYRPKARFATFLYRITTNFCLNEIRRFDHSRVEALEAPDAPDTKGHRRVHASRWADNHSPGPVRSLAGREAITELGKVLRRLPSNQRTALLLSRVDGLTHREVAENMDSSTASVKSLVFRATATLKKDLADVL